MKPWRKLSRPLTLTVRRAWAWGRDPRYGSVVLISPHGTVFECRLVRRQWLARQFQPHHST